MSLNVNGLRIPAKRRAIFKTARDGGYDVILLQETHCTSEVEHLWRTEWGGQMICAHGTSNARGVITLLKRASPWVVISQTRDLDGRFLSLIIEKNTEKFMVTNIYAPTQDQTNSQIDFIDQLEDATSDSLAPNIIIAGDFNLCMNPSLDRNSSTPEQVSSRYRDRIQALSDTLFLSDIWRHLHPSTKQFSFRRSGYASRLDYWLASDHLISLDTCSSIPPTPLSDHAIITLKVGPKPYPRGPGLWKFNNALLKEAGFTELINNTIQEINDAEEPENPNSRWEWMKFKIKERAVLFSKQLLSTRKQMESDLKKSYDSLCLRLDTGETDLREEKESIERELKEIQLEEANKIILRSRANWALHGEKP